MNPRLERLALAITLALYAIAALAFASAPLFEGPNEAEHYRYVRYVAQNRALPDPAGYPFGQFHQAPLYYVVGAPALMLIDDPEFEQISTRFNPYHAYEFGIPSRDNKNFHLHSADEGETGTARAVYALRGYSILLGVITVLVNYATLRLVWPDRPYLRLMGLGVVAFWPQFVYVSGMVNNDNAMFLTVALSFYLVLKQHRTGPTWQRSALLGVVLGLALLSKSSAAILCLPMGLIVLVDRRWWWPHAPITLSLTVLVAGGWYLNNLVQYGDPTGLQAFFATWETEIIQPGSIAWGVGLQRAWFGYESLWARFGQGAVSAPDLLYAFYDLLTLLGLSGAALWVARRLWAYTRRKADFAEVQQILIVLVFSFVWLLALIYSSSIAWSGNQGRYLLPGFAGWAILLVMGLTQFVPRRLTPSLGIGLPATLCAALYVVLIGTYLPAYRIQPAADPDAPAIYTYGNVADLIDVQPRQISATPGSVHRIRLSWRALATTEHDLLVYLHSMENDLIRRDSYPAAGLLLADDWQTGQTWTSEYIIRIPDDAPEQQVLTLVTGFYDQEAAQRLEATTASGDAVTPIIGRVEIHGPVQEIATDYRFGDSIELVEPAITRTDAGLQVCLTWVARARLNTDYTTFVHVFDATGEKITQQDFQPRDGRYPTSAWLPDEPVQDCRTLSAADAAEAETLLIGLYDPATVVRLPVVDAVGSELRDRAVRVPF